MKHDSQLKEVDGKKNMPNSNAGFLSALYKGVIYLLHLFTII